MLVLMFHVYMCSIDTVLLYVIVAKDADEKEKWIFALENAIFRRDFNHVRTVLYSTLVS